MAGRAISLPPAPGPWTAGVSLVLVPRPSGGAQGGWTRALQAGRGRAGGRAGCGAACLATGQRVAGRGAAGARAPEQLRAETRVAARMLGQVVAAGKALGAERAGEALLAGVRPVVTGQLVGARELLVAARPVTGKGALTWVGGSESKQAVVSEGDVPSDPKGKRHLSPSPLNSTCKIKRCGCAKKTTLAHPTTP